MTSRSRLKGCLSRRGSTNSCRSYINDIRLAAHILLIIFFLSFLSPELCFMVMVTTRIGPEFTYRVFNFTFQAIRGSYCLWLEPIALIQKHAHDFRSRAKKSIGPPHQKLLYVTQREMAVLQPDERSLGIFFHLR